MPPSPLPPPPHTHTPHSLYPQVVNDPVAKAAYLSLGTQWVAFDTPQTLWMKIQAAKQMGLGGLMVRAVHALQRVLHCTAALYCCAVFVVCSA